MFYKILVIYRITEVLECSVQRPLWEIGGVVVRFEQGLYNPRS